MNTVIYSLHPDLLGISQERAHELFLMIKLNPGRAYEFISSLPDFDEAMYAAYLAGNIDASILTTN